MLINLIQSLYIVLHRSNRRIPGFRITTTKSMYRTINCQIILICSKRRKSWAWTGPPSLLSLQCGSVPSRLEGPHSLALARKQSKITNPAGLSSCHSWGRRGSHVLQASSVPKILTPELRTGLIISWFWVEASINSNP